MHTLSVRELIQGLQTKQFSSVELTQHYLQRIQASRHLNAFIHVDEDLALQSAAMADKAIHNQSASALTGLPLAHKDIFCTHDLPTTCGSKMLAGYQSPFDATVVERLRHQGTVLLGKTNMDEFAMGSANDHSHFGPTKNPWDTSCVPGGSSGGSAASVAAGLTPFATGSDTGGSIRQPAAFCNLTGLKPTYGLVSRFGMIAYASSLDQGGPMARSAEDIAQVMPFIAGHDERDSTSVHSTHADYSSHLHQSVKGIRIGVPRSFFQSDLDPSIHQAIMSALDLYQQQGAQVIDIDLTHVALWVPCYYVIACAEASSNLARYDGIRFGHHAKHAETLQQLIMHSRSEGFGLEVKRRVLTGTYILSSGYYDAYYVQAQKIRRMIQNELLQHLQEVDVILSPTTPTCAFPSGKPSTNPTQRYLADIYTVAANLAGIPAISFPVGFSTTTPQPLPIGMQLMGRPFSEHRLLQLAHQYQHWTDWHTHHPEDIV